MQTLLSRAVTLSVARTANQAIAILGPILLVRLLTVDQYGSYREFVLYATVITPLILFGVPNSLAYFVPRHPEREQNWLTQTALVTFAATMTAIALIYLAGDPVRASTSFDFVVLLQVYLFFSVNLDFVEYYWLARKRTDLVLLYSLSRQSARLAAVVLAAWLWGDIRIIVYALIGVEAARFIFVLAIAVARGWFAMRVRWPDLRLQASYFLPLGSGGALEALTRHVGALFVSIVMGPEALAMYVIGAFVLEIVNILRGTIADVIFPDIVGLRSAEPRDMLPLWQKATIWYGVTLFPMAVLLCYYADAFVTLLFTSAYAQAIPVFALLSLMLVVDAFDFHLPLRARNANRYYVRGTLLAGLVNIGAIYPLYFVFGLTGPAVALLVSRLALTAYLGHHTVRLYDIEWRRILPWRALGGVLSVAVTCAALLVVGKLVSDISVVRIGLFGAPYLAGVMLALRWLGIWDFWPVARRLLRLTGRRGGGQP